MPIETRDTKFGQVKRFVDGCKDDFDNIRVYDQGGGKQIVELQGPAMRAFKDAEIAVWKRMHPLKWKLRQRRGREPGVEHIIVLAGSKRTCAGQAELYARDPKRYAPPWVGLHPQGLAIDVSQAQRARKLRIIYEELLRRGWTRTRPTDEPWHWSFGWTA